MLKLQAWTMATFTVVRDRVDETLRRDRENGVTTLEYVVIAGILFAAALALAVFLRGVISRRQANIN